MLAVILAEAMLTNGLGGRDPEDFVLDKTGLGYPKKQPYSWKLA